VIHTDKWAFMHIPKTGGMNFIKRSNVRDEVTNRHIDLPKFWVHKPLQYWIDQGFLDKQYLFTFVRNPYDRLVSLYNHIKVRGNAPDLPDFKTFVMTDWLKVRGQIDDFNIAAPMVDFLKTNSWCEYGIYKFEDGFEPVEQIVGYKFSDTFINKNEHPHYWDYYDDESRKITYLKYEKDFERFGYSYMEAY
tara:strand:+ start:985 stop:1557 length:573 start_codon:yes stop_codon:yes gene_type:complete